MHTLVAWYSRDKFIKYFVSILKYLSISSSILLVAWYNPYYNTSTFKYFINIFKYFVIIFNFLSIAWYSRYYNFSCC
jgi:hypothetical protein